MANERSPDQSEENAPNSQIEKTPLVKKLDNQELKNTGFWLSQLFMIISTIVGVYLAAQSGLEQALTFDAYSKMEDNYYLRQSLHAELADNADAIEAYADEFLIRSRPLQEIKNFRPPLDRYVWETMKYNPTTLETPSSLITQARRFYSHSDNLMDRAERRALGANYAGKQLKQLVKKLREQTLPELKRSAEHLKKELSEKGVEIGSLKET
ncbi:hypothetical protein [Salinivibrio sharmensis]|uniref:hypothetical protein n=1 Tax=Salinivibrio sharmensis TaxID=390883 RepID=UPI001F16634F|nr:hypothetical protein [Salinivibrio sharmensis]